ncbi:hypothetical protein DL93DRAFT_2054074 [Clavulina sp. PMI_390]|nr:hypothetical protein DL93DRAFT_2054074 [Clavulina sp. PMI_390]
MRGRLCLLISPSLTLGVAFSGGPDSACLGFLLRRLILSGTPFSHSQERLNELLAFIVDHRLQDSSSAMTTAATRIAHELGIRPVISHIEWGNGIFPKKPEKGDALERVARRARYHLLHEALGRHDVSVLCFGHHLNDQIETSIVRLNSGSSSAGLSGMREIRRWGMGTREGYTDGMGWTGISGMSKWIARPLLGISKDRILATCEENRLEFVVDATNFQPDLTIRNQIRHDLEISKSNVSEPSLAWSRLLTYFPAVANHRLAPQTKCNCERAT